MSYLPYPGRYESHDSWMRRCDDFQRWNRRSQSRGLSGRPNKRYILGGKDGMTQGYFRIAGGDKRLVDIPMMGEHNGRQIRIYKIGYGWQNSQRVWRFAQKNGLEFHRYNGNGCSGMCERMDGMAFKYVDVGN